MKRGTSAACISQSKPVGLQRMLLSISAVETVVTYVHVAVSTDDTIGPAA